MELVKELRVREAECGKDLEEPLAALAHYCWKQAADELEAWLRESDNAVHESNLSSGARRWIRKRIFGTIPMSTTQEGK